MTLTEDELLAAANADPNDDTSGADRGDEVATGAEDAPATDAKAETDADDVDVQADANAEDADPSDKKPPAKSKATAQNMIPRARLNEARAKQKEAEARAAELERKLEEMSKSAPANKEFEKFTARVDELYEKVEVARAEGDYKEAAKLQRELDSMREASTRASAQYISQQAAVRAQQQAAYNAAVDQLEVLVPEIDPHSEVFDESVMEEIKDMTEAFEQRGKDSLRALRLATKAVLGRDPFAEKSDLRKTKAEPKKTNVAKNVAAVKKTPPEVEGRSVEKDQSNIEVDRLTDDEYAKLPKAVRERLRGDFV